MNTSTLRLAPDLVDLASLGADCFEDLMGWTEGLVGAARAELVTEGEGWKLWRIPLPGTPDESGLVTEAPKGSGTGWIRVKRYEGGGLSDAMRARLKQPRSSSFAVREWNLLCQLRERGLALAPEGVAVVRLHVNSHRPLEHRGSHLLPDLSIQFPELYRQGDYPAMRGPENMGSDPALLL